MEYRLTSKYQHSKRCSDNKRRNKILYFLNDIKIFEQRIPFDTEYELGFQNRTHISDVYLLDGNIYQKRQHVSDKSIREVRYPVSKKTLGQFNIPQGTRINLNI